MFLKAACGARWQQWAVPLGLFVLTFAMFVQPLSIPSNDCTPNKLLPISLIHDHDFYFNEFVSPSDTLPYYFYNRAGHIVSMYPVLPGILNTPVYLIAQVAGIDVYQNSEALSCISAALMTALSVVFMYLILLGIFKRRPAAVFFALVYAFATCVCSVAARAIWQHGPSLLFITAALYVLLKENKSLMPYAGFLLGMAVFNRPANILIALPLSVYVFFHYKDVRLKYAIWGAVPILACLIYSQVCLGSALHFGQGQGFSTSGKFWEGLAGILISPSRGLFVFSPIFIFSCVYLIAVLCSKSSKDIYKLLAVIVLAWIGLCATWQMWWGGWSFGYRLLIELVPILIIFLALCWENVIRPSPGLKAVFFICLALSLFFHYLGCYSYPDSAQFDSVPNDINIHTERLWDVGDSELARDAKLWWHKFAPHHR